MFGHTGLMCIWYGDRFNQITPPPTDNVITESGDDIVTESGDDIVVES